MALTTPLSPVVPASLAATPFTAKLERRILDFVGRNDILNPGETVVVAVSGGPDSTALLVALVRLRGALNIEITAAHFNHMLRSAEEAVADLDFARALAFTLGIPFAHAAGDVRARARAKHESLEDAGRRLRYAFLAGQAKDAGASVVVTGHTIDDQAETVLLHLIRGAGLDGIAGMRPRSPWPFAAREPALGDRRGPHLARPLLSLRREDTERYCCDLGLSPRKDPTNDLPVATRNRLRRELIPALRRFNPNIDEAIARFAAAAARDADYLDDLARHHFARIASLGPRTASMARADLLLATPALSARLFRLAFEHVSGAVDLETTHIETLLDALHRPPGKLSLSGGVTALTDSHSLLLRRSQPEPVQRIPETPLAVPGRIEVGGRICEANIVRVPAELSHTTPDEAFLDAERAGAGLTVRSRRPGDRLRPLGLGGEKKLQDILVDAKVPAAERDGVPIICGPQGIMWVVGQCIDGRYALDRHSRQALHLTITDS
jgi:tRNA(Ile)-lysidine synthetase-like protein